MTRLSLRVCLGLALAAGDCGASGGASIMMDELRRAHSAPPAPNSATFSPGIDGRSIAVSGLDGAGDSADRGSMTCPLDAAVERAQLTRDRKAVLLSGGQTFVTVESIRHCRDKPAPVMAIDPGGGILADVHVGRRVYLGLLLVTLQPWGFVAIVAPLESTQSLFKLPGSYRGARFQKSYEREAFGYSEDWPSPAGISRNGRYVTPSGDIDCDAGAYPGVWDLDTRKRVVLTGTPEDVRRRCAALFE